jgi:GT2 family glycosyltransferase
MFELKILLTDNSGDAEYPADQAIEIIRPAQNEGFSIPNNRAAERALREGFDNLLLLNPDCALSPEALRRMIGVLEGDQSAGVCCPKLLRADNSLRPLSPPTIDCTGIYFTPTLRHFDRGSRLIDRGQFDQPNYVFGASGACALVSVRMLRDFVSDNPRSESLLFDNNFFAYREDADLAWRMNLRGWRTRYEPAAVGYHVRKVVHSNRRDQSAEVNAYGVRNRFLLLANNWEPLKNPRTILPVLFRNFIIRTGVYLSERSSIPALRSVKALSPVAARTREVRLKNARVSNAALNRWFRRRPYAEPAITSPINTTTSDLLPTVQAVVVNYESGDRLNTCLASLRSIQPAGYILKISVVDNSKELTNIDTTGISYDHQPGNLGFAASINRVLKSSPADYLLTLNPDVALTSQALNELVSCSVKYSQLDAVAPVLINADGSPQVGFTVKRLPTFLSCVIELLGMKDRGYAETSSIRYEDDPLLQQYLRSSEPAEKDRRPYYQNGIPIPVEQPAAACLLVRCSTLDEIGGFDERFYPAWFEDVDLCRRLRDGGKVVAVLNTARVVHEGGYTVKYLGRSQSSALYFKNMARYWAKHGNFFERISIRLLASFRSRFL